LIQVPMQVTVGKNAGQFAFVNHRSCRNCPLLIFSYADSRLSGG
jgi:hypothetical protein